MEITEIVPKKTRVVVDESYVTLKLSMKEARVLRDLYGKSCGRLSEDLGFLSGLNDLFPDAYLDHKAEAGFVNVYADYEG